MKHIHSTIFQFVFIIFKIVRYSEIRMICIKKNNIKIFFWKIKIFFWKVDDSLFFLYIVIMVEPRVRPADCPRFPFLAQREHAVRMGCSLRRGFRPDANHGQCQSATGLCRRLPGQRPGRTEPQTLPSPDRIHLACRTGLARPIPHLPAARLGLLGRGGLNSGAPSHL